MGTSRSHSKPTPTGSKPSFLAKALRLGQTTGCQDALVALSLSNLLFLRVWRELLDKGPSAYWLPDFTQATYLAIILNVISIAIVLWLVASRVRRTNHPAWRILGRIGFFGLLVFPLEYARTVLNVYANVIHWFLDHWLVSGFVAMVLVILLVRVGGLLFRWVTHAQYGLLLILSPFCLMTLLPAASRALSMSVAKDVAAAKPAVPSVLSTEKKRPRIIWLLFDELDSSIAFLDRPDNVELPEFDRMRGESVVALNCMSHRKGTTKSLPSFFIGSLVSRAKPVSKGNVLLNFEGQPPGQFTPFSDCDTLFRGVRSRGGRSAVVGYYLPYSRLLKNDVDHCSTYTLNTYTPFATNSVLIEARSQLLGITPLYRRLNCIQTYKGILRETLALVEDKTYDVVFVHVSVPHVSIIFDRHTDRFTLTNIAKDGYLDNLVLADHFLGKVRSHLEQEGLWNDSLILVNSDHELRDITFGGRKRIPIMPLMIKMPGAREQVMIEESISPHLIVKDLLLSVLDGEIKTTADVVRRLKQDGKKP